MSLKVCASSLSFEGHMVVYGSVRHQNNIIWTEASEAVYGPVRHQKSIIWTEACEVHIIFVW
jgi:hypothetical protein